MSRLSAVSQSVSNTVKRAVLIWLSVLYFGNPVNHWGIVGSAVIFVGVLFYNYAILTTHSAPKPDVEKAAQF